MWAAPRTIQLRLPTSQVGHAAGTVGASDAFISFFIYLLSHKFPEECGDAPWLPSTAVAVRQLRVWIAAFIRLHGVRCISQED